MDVKSRMMWPILAIQNLQDGYFVHGEVKSYSFPARLSRAHSDDSKVSSCVYVFSGKKYRTQNSDV